MFRRKRYFSRIVYLISLSIIAIIIINTFFHDKLVNITNNPMESTTQPKQINKPEQSSSSNQEGKYRCRQSGEFILQEYFDDDYCDCADGTDEPHTNACSHIATSRFSCGLRCSQQTIPSSRVNDGICDCCDGSDELRASSKPNPYLLFLKDLFKTDIKFVSNPLQKCQLS